MLANAGRTVGRVVLGWDGVTAQPHRFGGVTYMLGERELGHVHGDQCADIPLPAGMRTELVEAGVAELHPLKPEEWVTVAFREEIDAQHAVALFRRSYELALTQWARHAQADRRARRVVGLDDLLADGLA
jgi:hypothetical protein